MKNIKVGEAGKVVYIENITLNYGTGVGDIAKDKIQIKWIIIPISIFIIISLAMWIKFNLPLAIYGLSTIIGLISIVWFSTSIHLRFKNKYVTSLWGASLFFVFLLCMGLFKLNEVAMTFWHKVFIKYFAVQ